MHITPEIVAPVDFEVKRVQAFAICKRKDGSVSRLCNLTLFWNGVDDARADLRSIVKHGLMGVHGIAEVQIIFRSPQP